ncbi:arylamine N-acetyltransferase [Aggregicoccus sp. 17bor-14]|uniref:arylamine N-acetyltransferase family protein n=1 Tax=Myxococcaceae TaxID=31 RepID=UPI00129D0BBB|nr:MULTISPECIES: arylamine N-acetyltransferase [Myxococcaceae]MBF5043766.1 arylamine N-acetyltransferase [Simulacricoccus sp. 17bor-14]MRI89520.1 arylamine N-acetyltransferase [Aggregicoccus sp. 17bor-14]
MDAAAYTRRIGYEGPLEPTLEVLTGLCAAHIRTVPFENLAIHEGARISLEPEALFHKVVLRRRGGYCFELNGLFSALLKALGFQVEHLLGRVWFSNPTAPVPTHQVSRVALGGERYLVDVGFGARVLRAPLPWRLDAPVAQGPDTFRLVRTDNDEVMLQSHEPEGWRNLYSLLPCTVRPQDYVPANHYTSTHPASSFVLNAVAALTTPEGRITFRNRELRRTTAAGTEVRELAHPAELAALLASEFGLEDWTDRAALERFLFPGPGSGR